MNLGRRYVAGYGFLSFAKNICKNLSHKYGEKLLDSAKKSTADAIKTASKRTIQKAAETTGDLISNKIPNKITSVWKQSEKSYSDDEMEAPKKDTYPQEKDNKLLMN